MEVRKRKKQSAVTSSYSTVERFYQLWRYINNFPQNPPLQCIPFFRESFLFFFFACKYNLNLFNLFFSLISFRRYSFSSVLFTIPWYDKIIGVHSIFLPRLFNHLYFFNARGYKKINATARYKSARERERSAQAEVARRVSVLDAVTSRWWTRVRGLLCACARARHVIRQLASPIVFHACPLWYAQSNRRLTKAFNKCIDSSRLRNRGQTYVRRIE